MATARMLAAVLWLVFAWSTCVTNGAPSATAGGVTPDAGPRKRPSKQLIPDGEAIVSPFVMTPLGNISGKFGTNNGDDATLESFLGVPFAEPPIGELRFRHPVPVKPWNGTLDATTFCSSCVTNSMTSTETDDPEQVRVAEPEVDMYTKDTDVEDEDCLCMSIWRPTGTKQGDDLPVAFFIHGGGFVSGDSSITWYNGGNFSRAQEMVVVSINYRLGPLGFLSSEEIEAQGEGGNGGLNGLLDQILALQFVQDYIEYFGGDPSNVGIFGESAGGLSVCMLSVSPLAKGLFQRSIAESAACTGPWGPGVTEWGLNISAQVLESVGVSSIAEAREVAASAFQWPSYYGASNPGYGGVPWLTSEAPGTWIDGYVLTKPPLDYYAAGELNVHEFLIGGNSEDGITPYYEYIAPIPQSNDAYSTAMATHWGEYVDAVIAQYPLSGGEGTDATAAATQFVKADGEYNCNCAIAGPETSWAALLLEAGATVYHYYFYNGPSLVDESVLMGVVPTGSYGWASHWSEIPYVFGTTTNGYGFFDPFSAEEVPLKDTIMNYWGSFMKSGTPEDASNYGPAWPEYSMTNKLTMGLAVQPTVLEAPLDDNCAFWSDYYPSSGSM